MHQSHKRGQWTTKFGFILATAGAAIGLGNLWKFPYLMGRNGGFAFLLVYLIFIVVLGLPVMITEMSIGRMTQQNPVNAYKSIHKKATFIGVLGVLAAFLILSYYSVIGGWIIKYIVSYASTLAAPADFGAYIAEPVQPIVWHFVFMICAAVVCYKGTKGIEKASTVMMPLLFILLVVIIVRSITLPGAIEGLKFVFVPNSNLTLSGATAAMGQVFYSLSLGMGITITYGSYLKKDENIPKSCATIAGLDTLAALMAGVAIFPAVFALGLQPEQGPSLIFGTLPAVFSRMPLGGPFFALLFFVLMFFAALTSSIALLECVVAFTVDNWHWSRRKSVTLLTIAIALLGVPSALSFGPLSDFTILGYSFFDFMGVITDNLLMPLGGLAMCVYVGWFWGPGKIIAHVESSGVKFKLQKAWIWSIRIISPIMVAAVMIMGFVNVYRFITGIA